MLADALTKQRVDPSILEKSSGLEDSRILRETEGGGNQQYYGVNRGYRRARYPLASQKTFYDMFWDFIIVIYKIFYMYELRNL